MLAAPKKLGADGGFREDVAGVSCVPKCLGSPRLEGGFRRWHLRPGEKGGASVGKTRKGKGTKIMMVTDGEGMPLASHIDSASPAEVTLIEKTLAKIAVGKAGRAGAPRQKPERLVADRAYDSNGLRRRLAGRGILPIIPARSTSLSATHQDRRRFRRYARRWKVERTFAWLLSFRRITVRWERLDFMYGAFVHLACAFIVMRRL